MEPDQERIARIATATGATEEEALVLFHLQQARTAWNELEPEQTGGFARTQKAMMFNAPHQALVNMVLARIARRDHPEAWGG